MRIIKLGIISFIFLFGLVTVMSLFIPSHVRISRATNLAPTAGYIIQKIADTARWNQWHPGFMDSSGVQPNYQLRRIPVSLKKDEFVCKVQQGERKPVNNGWKLYSNSPGDSLTLQWYMDFQLSWYPWQKFSSLFYESAYGSMMEKGMTNLKASAH
jgi:hypothetical protein